MSKNRISQLRNAKDLSQSHLAKIVGVGTQTIANWENGRREPSIDNLYMLSNIFETTIDYILCNVEDSKRGFPYMDCNISECLDGRFLCKNIPEAIVITKALSRMSMEQRERMLDICRAAYPDEFNDLIHYVQSDDDLEALL